MTPLEFSVLAFSSLFVIVDPIAMKITTRIMGLLLAAVAIQFMINALKELKLVPS